MIHASRILSALLLAVACSLTASLEIRRVRSAKSSNIKADADPPVSENDMASLDDCFKDENAQPVPVPTIEHNSRTMVRKWIQHTDTVLEIGARYGTVSCTIAQQLNQSGKVVSVEPDSLVWNALEKNLNDCQCNVKLFKGSISNHSLEQKADDGWYGYGKEFGLSRVDPIPFMTFVDIQTKFGMSFNVLEADCEGCFPKLLDENPGLVSNLRLIIVEAHTSDEEAAVLTLTQQGFREVDGTGRQRVIIRESSD